MYHLGSRLTVIPPILCVSLGDEFVQLIMIDLFAMFFAFIRCIHHYARSYICL